MKKKSVGVIGAGIIGINCAIELQALGYSVTIIDKDGIGEGCSKKNAGHFATEQVFPLADPKVLFQIPKMLLDPLGPMALSPKYFPKAFPWFLRFIFNMRKKTFLKNSDALKMINNCAIDYYLPLLEKANAEHLLTKLGSLLVFEQTPFKRVQQEFEHYRNAGVPVELLKQDELRSLEPNLSTNVTYGLYFTDVAHTSCPYEICTALANYGESLGMNYTRLQVNEIQQHNDCVKLSCANSHGATETSLEFDHVVVAAGAWSKKLLNQLGYQLPLEVERGYSLDVYSTNKNPISRPIASFNRKFIMTPMAHGLRLSGTVEFAGLKQKANMKRAEMLYEHAKDVLNSPPISNEKTSNEEQKWMGFRPSLPDSLPVIGKAPKHNRICFALGHQHLGLTLGAITGKLIGQVVSKQKTDISLKPYCISRFN